MKSEIRNQKEIKAHCDKAYQKYVQETKKEERESDFLDELEFERRVS